MVSSLNFSRARLGVLPTVASRSAFHHCQSIWRQSDHQVLFSYLSRFLMLTVAPQTDFILGGRCLQLPYSEKFLSGWTSWYLVFHPILKKAPLETDLLIESYRHFPHSLLSVNTSPKMYALTQLSYVNLLNRPDSVWGVQEIDEKPSEIREVTPSWDI